MKLGVLDFGAIPAKSNGISYIYNLIEEVKILDELNFSRCWLTEHQSNASAWQTPEIVISLLAAYTKRIRIGVAGVLLPIHSTHKIAACYKLLNNLYADRIDLGISKGIVPDNLLPYYVGSKTALNNLLEKHYERIREIINIYEETETGVTPIGGANPQIWLLGASTNSMPFAINNHLPICFSHFHLNTKLPSEIEIKKFRELYLLKNGRYPVITLGISILCSKSKAKLQNMEKRLVNNTQINLNLKGDISFIKSSFYELKEKYFVDEFVIVNLIDKKKERWRFYEDIATEIA